MKRKTKILLILVVVILVGVFFWNKNSKKEPEINYQTERAAKTTLVASVSASGKITSTNIANVTTQVSGTVKQLFVKEGDVVQPGQKILEITPDTTSQQKMSQAYASYLSAKNSLDTATINLYSLQSAAFAANDKFMKDAVERDLSTEDPVYIQQHADWLAAEAKYKQQSSVIAQAQAALNNASLSYQLTSSIVTAPTSGVITNISAIGTAISSSNNSSTTTTQAEKVAIIENNAPPTISVNLSEMDVVKIKIGQRATITLDSIPDKTFTGTVTTLDKIGSQSSGVTSYPAIITLDSDNEHILPNMSANASIITDTKDAVIAIPQAAVQTQNGISSARVMRNRQPETVQVELGIYSDTQIEITSGINEGDEVIISSLTTGSSNQSGTSVFGGSLGGPGGFRTGGMGGGQAQFRRN